MFRQSESEHKVALLPPAAQIEPGSSDPDGMRLVMSAMLRERKQEKTECMSTKLCGREGEEKKREIDGVGEGERARARKNHKIGAHGAMPCNETR